METATISSTSSRKRWTCRAGAFLLLALARVWSPAYAQAAAEQALPAMEAPPQQTLFIRGFATLGLARGSSGDVGVVSSYAQKNAVFDRWSANLDSVIGGQAAWRPGTDDAVVLQAVARAGEDWNPKVALAFWKHRLTPGFSARIGRIAAPLYRDSDVIDVGYASLTVRPALPIYLKVNAMRSFDGIDGTWQFGLGEALVSLQAYYGGIRYRHVSHPDDSGDLDASGPGMRGLALALRSGTLSVRASHSSIPRFSLHSRDTAVFDALLRRTVAAMRANPFLAARADTLAAYEDPMSRRARYTSIGFEWLPQDWRVDGEWSRYQSDSYAVGSGNAWQLTVGRAFGRATPYAFVSRQTAHLKSLNEADFAATGVPQIDAALGGARTWLAEAGRSADISMHSAGLGIRYEVAENMALKLQYERSRSAYAMAVAPGRPRLFDPPPVKMLSIVLDMTF